MSKKLLFTGITKLNSVFLFLFLVLIAMTCLDFKEDHYIRLIPSNHNDLERFYFKEIRTDRKKIAQAKALLNSKNFHFSFIENNNDNMLNNLLKSFILTLNEDDSIFYKELFQESQLEFVKVFTDSMKIYSSEKVNDLTIVIDFCNRECSLIFGDMIEKTINFQIKETYSKLYNDLNFTEKKIRYMHMIQSTAEDRSLLMTNLSLLNRLDTINKLPLKTITYKKLNIRLAILLTIIFMPVFYLINIEKWDHKLQS